MTDYIVIQTKQFGVETNDPEEALRKVIDGEGILISVNYSASPRPSRPQPGATPSTPTAVQPTAAQKLEAKK